MLKQSLLQRQSVRAHFDRAAETYTAAAVLQHEVESRLQERLEWLKTEPSVVLDIGCGPGAGVVQLAQRFSKAKIIALDFAANMLHQARQQRSWLARWRRPIHYLQADAQALPLAAASIDLLYSNLCIQWVEDLPTLFAEWRRVLKPGSMVLFSSFGPDTLKELRGAWSLVDDKPHVNRFVDMHIVGDALQQAGFKDPVMESETICLSYSQVSDLLRELKAIGASNAMQERSGGLGGKDALKQMMQHYPKSADGKIVASFEVVYALCWAPPEGAPIRHASAEVASVSLSKIPIRRKAKAEQSDD